MRVIFYESVRCAVPLFFIISGYLYFKNIGSFTVEKYLKKLKSRFRSLIIPYFIWNTITFIIIKWRVIVFFDSSLHDVWDLIQFTYLGVYYTEANNAVSVLFVPIDFPLWFLRDLIILVILSPVIYFMAKYIRKFVLIILSICFLMDYWPSVLFFNLHGILFFTLGAWLSIKKIDPSRFMIKHKKLTIFLCWLYPVVVIWDVVSYRLYPDINSIFHTFQILLSVYAIYAYFLFYSLKNTDYRSNISGGLVFAIYVMHALVLGAINNPVFMKKFIASLNISSVCANLVFSFIIYMTVLGVCFVGYRILKNISPDLSNILFGERSVPPVFRLR